MLSRSERRVQTNAHVSWSLFIDLGLLFIYVYLGSVGREEGDGGAEPIAVLGRREHADWVLHRGGVLDYDAAVVYGVVDEAQVGADVSRAC